MNKPQRFSSRIRGHRAGERRRSILPELRDDRRAAETLIRIANTPKTEYKE
jgi:hypothetical protein